MSEPNQNMTIPDTVRQASGNLQEGTKKMLQSTVISAIQEMEEQQKMVIDEILSASKKNLFPKFTIPAFEVPLPPIPKFDFLEDVVKEFQKTLDVIKPILEKVETEEKACDVYARLGKYNWILPLKIDSLPDEITSMTEDSCIDVDSIVRKLYLENDNEMLHWVIEKTKESLPLPSQKQMLMDAERAYYSGMYFACCYTLAPLIEGVPAAFISVKHQSDLFKLFRNAALQSIGCFGYTFHLLASVSNFLKNYIVTPRQDFSNPNNEPKLLNRHWLLHGRSQRQITDIDCLQLFGAIWGLLTLCRQCEFSSIETDNDMVREFIERCQNVN